jgi:hypothetical protein
MYDTTITLRNGRRICDVPSHQLNAVRTYNPDGYDDDVLDVIDYELSLRAVHEVDPNAL